MGNAQQQAQDFSVQYQEIRKEDDYQIIQHKETKVRYMLKEFGFGDKKQYEKQLQKYTKIATRNQNESILNIVKVHNRQFNNLCANTYKIYVIYEFPSVTLQEQIVARKKQDKYFDQCQLWAILQSCINGLQQVKPTISLQPSSIFIVPDGLLKIINDDMIREDYRCLINENYYYAPEKIKKFNQVQTIQSLKHQMIFSLGMTLLHTSLLQPVQDCYDFQKMEYKQEKLQYYLESVIDKYSDEFIQLLICMLEPQPEKRANLQEIKKHLDKVWNGDQNQIENKQEQEQIQNDNEQVQEIFQQQSNYQQQIEQNRNQNQIVQQTHQQQTCANSYKVSTDMCSHLQSKMLLGNQQNQYDKENIFTDPKLLEMIRNDLQNIRELKTTTLSYPENQNRNLQQNHQIENIINKVQLH